MQQFIRKMARQNDKEKLNLDSIQSSIRQAPTFQTLLSNPILPRLFDYKAMENPRNINTWIKAIRIANRLLDIGIDVNSLYEGNNILNNLVEIYSELEEFEMNGAVLSLYKKFQDLMIRVLEMGVDPNLTDHPPLLYCHLFNPNSRACRDPQSIKVFDELIRHGASPDFEVDTDGYPSFKEYLKRGQPNMLQRMQKLIPQVRIQQDQVKRYKSSP